MDLIAQRDFVEGRRVLSRLLYANRLTPRDARMVRDTLASVNQMLIFSDKVVQGDSVAEYYTVQRGDYLATIAPALQDDLPVPSAHINGIDNPSRLAPASASKCIKGPFNVYVDKSSFLMDITLPGPDGTPLYVCSFPVGLGEDNSTPVGQWMIAPDSKVTNPDYRNPRTGEHFERDDPGNPVGEYWLGLKGMDDNTRGRKGYGIHGTIAPDSIGTQASMGCIRLRNDDIKAVFHMLVAGESHVTIRSDSLAVRY